MECATEDEEGDDLEEVVNIERSHFGNKPCIVGKIESLLVSVLETCGWKTHRQVRFKVYSEATTYIRRPGMGKKQRRFRGVCN